MAKAIAAQTRPEARHEPAVPERGAREPHRQLLPVHSRARARSRARRSTSRRARRRSGRAWSRRLAVALIMLVFAPYARFIPRAALAGILMVSAWKMVDWRALAYHLRATRFDAAIVAVTAFSAVAISIEFCVLIGVFMSFLLTVPRAGRMLLTEFVIAPRRRRPRAPARRRALRAHPDLRPRGRDVLRRDRARSRRTSRRSRSASGRRRSVVVLRVKRARNPDAVGLTLLEGFLDRMQARGVHVLLCGVRARVRRQARAHRPRRRGSASGSSSSSRCGRRAPLLAIRHAYELIGPSPARTCPRRDGRAAARRAHYEI